jgi:DNA-binding Lrp family transcriptional regulator
MSHNRSEPLDALDRQLIHALQIDGRAPFSQIAAALGVSDQTVARRYRKLRTSGAMRVLGLPDARRFGHVEWLIRIQCAPDAASGMAASLGQRDDTSWVILTAGGTEIVCFLRAPALGDSTPLLLQKLPRSPRVVDITAHYILNTFAGGPTGWYGRSHDLTQEQIALLTQDLPPTPDADTLVTSQDGDAGLFGALALDGRIGYRELTQASGLSETTTKRRLGYLREAGALYFDVEIDSRLLGHHAKVMLWLSVPPADLDKVGRGLADHPEIVFSAATTGRTNLAAIVVCRDTKQFYDYLTSRIGPLGVVRAMETAPMIREVKRAGSIAYSTLATRPHSV